VELRTRGWAVGISRVPEEHVLTTFFRLNREQRSKLNYLRVKFYRVVDRYRAFRLWDKYVVTGRALIPIEEEFRKIYEEFLEMRREIYEELMSRWDEISERLLEYSKRAGLDIVHVERLKPESSDFLDLYYTLTPLPRLLNQIYRTYEDFLRLAEEKEEYRRLAERVKDKADRMIGSLRDAYESKIEELEKVIKRLREEVKKGYKRAYVLQLKAERMIEEAGEIEKLCGEETIEDLKFKLEALKEHLVEEVLRGKNMEVKVR